MSKFVSLTVSHRSTLPIMKFAEAVQGRATVSSGRPGRTPIWFRCQTEAKGIVSMRDWLLKAIEKYPGQMTAVICHDLGEAKDALSLLKPTFGGAIRLGDSTIFAFDEGIVVSAVKEVKGLEFTNVAIWNPSARRYPDMQENRNALYIAATRAEENLALVTWAKPSPLLPDFKSDLVRGMLVLEEEEQQDDNFEKQRHV